MISINLFAKKLLERPKKKIQSSPAPQTEPEAKKEEE